MASYGFIYILSNQYMDGVYKIGFTDRAPLQRVQELSNSTSCPYPFEIVCYGETDQAQSKERQIHDIFKDERISDGREFFYFGLAEVMRACNLIENNCENFTTTQQYQELNEQNINRIEWLENSKKNLKVIESDEVAA